MIEGVQIIYHLRIDNTWGSLGVVYDFPTFSTSNLGCSCKLYRFEIGFAQDRWMT